MANILDRLTDILRDVFENDALVATDDLSSTEVEGWDSMGNVRLFLAIEEAFGVRFNVKDTRQRTRLCLT